MDYDYEKTSVSLYRAVFKDNYFCDVSCYLKPDKDMANVDNIAPILHPTFDAIAAGGVHSRPPDIVSNRMTGMYEPDTGGTSVFDRAGVLRRSDGDFRIPEKTDIPSESESKEGQPQ